MIMTSDGENLTGLWFEDSSDSTKHTGDYKEMKLRAGYVFCEFPPVFGEGFTIAEAEVLLVLMIPLCFCCRHLLV